MFHLPISTLRYYDKEGLFPNLERKGNIRQFSDTELEAIRVIECLKKSGLEIKEIKQFFKWVSEGSSTYANRKNLFEFRKTAVEEEIKALADGNENKLKEMIPNKLPAGIQQLYDKAHS